MPIPKSSMGACMSKLKSEKPGGFGDVGDAHKQRIAICMKETGGKSKKKKTNEGMTFKEYLSEEAERDDH